MNVDLIDKEGTQIQATFFGDAVYKFAPILKENKVFLLANGQVKIANKKFTSIKNDYCLTFDMNGDIQEVEDDAQIKKQGFAFVGIKAIQDMVQQ